MAEGADKRLSPDRKVINPFARDNDPEVVDAMANLFIALVRKQGEYHSEGGKGKTVKRKPPC